MYTIYKITSPSGRAYIGLTKGTAKDRWRKHIRRSETREKRHPFYDAIKKYGAESFCVDQIDTAPDKASAQALERAYIAAAAPGSLYNVSPGGEADGEIGSFIFWATMAADPVAKQAYLKKLSDVKKARDWSDYSALSEKAAQWRKENPRAAYYQGYRANRIARRSVPPKVSQVPDLKTRLMWKHKRGSMTQKNALALWARRTADEIQDVGSAISDGVKGYWLGVTDPAVRAAKTADARAAIDRQKQGAAASKGLKSFWAELKADPARYAEHMARRSATLKKKNGEKL